MTTKNFTLAKESEKATLFIVGFKFNENRPSIVYGVNGEENLRTGYLVECWIPKSVIATDGTIADWFTKKVYDTFGRFNQMMDVIFN